MGLKEAIKKEVVAGVCATLGIPPNIGQALLKKAEESRKGHEAQAQPEEAAQQSQSTAPRMTYTKEG